VKQLLQLLERWLGNGPGGKKRVSAIRWLLLVGLTGIVIMILNSFMHVKDANSISDSDAAPMTQEVKVFGSKEQIASEFEEYEGRYEARIKEILAHIVGVGELDVMITIHSTEELVVERNSQQTQQVTNEKDQDGGTRHITNITRNGEVVLYEVSGEQTPIILKRIKPKIRGVLIVAKGAENVTVKKLIIQAVERGLGVPANHISVIPRKQ
jgi:stage III sporulation protein AG